MNQSNIVENININRSKEDKDKKRNIFDSINALYEGRELPLNAFRSGIIPRKEKTPKRLEILTPEEMLQRLPIALVQVKAGNTSENFTKRNQKIIYSLYRAKEITKNVYNNIIHSIKL